MLAFVRLERLILDLGVCLNLDHDPLCLLQLTLPIHAHVNPVVEISKMVSSLLSNSQSSAPSLSATVTRITLKRAHARFCLLSGLRSSRLNVALRALASTIYYLHAQVNRITANFMTICCRP